MIITYDDFPAIREKYKGKQIIFCSGTFDLTHAGHILFFEDCKKLGDILVVGVGDDETIKSYKGETRPILNEHIRLKTVDSLRPVDYCFLDNPKEKGEKTLFSPLSVIFGLLKPDKYVVNDESFKMDYRMEMCKKELVDPVVLKRWCPKEFDGISTTQIIEKVKSLD